MSLDAEHSTLTKTGTITLSEGEILIKGFDGEGCSCRDVAALALAWAIGKLQQELVATIERPGGGIAVVD